MDRRAFLTGVGTIGAASAAGWSAVESSARGARAAGLAKAAGAVAAGSSKAAALPHGLRVGYLRGSAGLLDYASRGQQWDSLANQMRWAEWDPSLQYPSHESRVDVVMGRMQVADVWANPGLTRMVEVVAHFALDVSPNIAAFGAYRFDGAQKNKSARSTSPLVFEAGMPDRVGLQVNYAFAPEPLVGLASTGMVYLPIGARDGPDIGIYVLASPSRVTGAAPELTQYRFGGDLRSPLVRADTGGTAEFDFVPFTIAPIRA